MLSKTKKDILNEYDDKYSLYVAYGRKLQNLIEEILTEARVSYHSVSFRCKERSSLERKLNKRDVSYKFLADITDISGVRIITYFDDEVKKASKLLEREFNIDAINSIDKSETLDPDRFGYLSVHYVVSNGEERNKLTEYKKFSGIKAEIQVRSILQHAWAEIEHDLGYKSPQGIPRAVRRRFSRLAGLLELADQEFYTIREELSSYSNDVLEVIETSPKEVELDTISLKAFIATSNLVKRLDSAIAESGDCRIYDYGNDDYDKEVRRLIFFGVHTVDEVMNLLSKHEIIILKFSKAWLNRSEIDENATFSPGICLFYLCYVLCIKTGDMYAIESYVDEFVGIGDEQSPSELAKELVTIFKNLELNKVNLS